MKTKLLALVFAVLAAMSADAQISLYWDPTLFTTCYGGQAALTTHAAASPGLSPADSALPAIIRGQPVQDTLYLTNYMNLAGQAINYVRIDSIYLPASLCWQTNKANNTFSRTENGAIIISGTTRVPAGQYKLRIIVSVVAGGSVSYVHANAESLLRLRYSLRIVCNGNQASPFNKSDTVSTYIADTASCTGIMPTAGITADGPLTFCPGRTVRLIADPGQGYRYRWSTGDTTRSIIRAQAGSYSVTVYYRSDSAVSAPISVSLATACTVAASITAHYGSISPGGIDTLTAGSGANYHYLWSTGDTIQTIVIHAPGNYTLTVSNGYASATANQYITDGGSYLFGLYRDFTQFSQCNRGTNAITPQVGTSPGFSPADSLMPCLTSGEWASDTLYFKNYNRLNGDSVLSLKIDSIYTPAGLVWNTNKNNNTFAGGENGVILLRGYPAPNSSQYKLRIIADVRTTTGIYTAVNLETFARLRYCIRLACPGATCMQYDHTDTVSPFINDPGSIASTCGSSLYSAQGGYDTLCPGDSVILTAAYFDFPNAHYLWSTGDTTYAITVYTPGLYTGTVYSPYQYESFSSGHSVYAAQICHLSAAITAGGPTTICPGGAVMLTTDSTPGARYRWSRGDTTRTIYASAAGSYTVTVSVGPVTAISPPTIVSVDIACHVRYDDPTYFSSCQAGTNTVTPVPAALSGIVPPYQDLPCAVIGTAVSDTLYFTNFSTLLGNAVYYMKIDSIYLPAGLCWSTNHANNQFTGGESGVIVIQGTPTAPAGQYKLKLIVDLSIANNSIAYNIDPEFVSGLSYYMRIACSGQSCMAFDMIGPARKFVPDAACATDSSAVSPRGPVSLCAGQSALLTADSASGYAYLWSTGATGRSISVATTGSYTVTVIAQHSIRVSAPVTVTVHPLPTAGFQLSAVADTPHHWVALDLSSGSSLTYIWSWGDGSRPDTLATPAHMYDSAGSYTICVSVYDQYGCQDAYCDSNAYLYKTAGQMVSVAVVQHPLSISDISAKQFTISFYGGAIHFSSDITSPADIRLYDLSGKLITRQSNFTGNILPADGDISDGIYIVSVQNNSLSLTRKLSMIR